MKKRTKYTPNEIIDYGDYCEIILCDAFGKKVSQTKIDRNDLGIVEKYKWHLSGKGYARTCNNHLNIFLHQVLCYFLSLSYYFLN